MVKHLCYTHNLCALITWVRSRASRFSFATRGLGPLFSPSYPRGAGPGPLFLSDHGHDGVLPLSPGSWKDRARVFIPIND